MTGAAATLAVIWLAFMGGAGQQFYDHYTGRLMEAVAPAAAFLGLPAPAGSHDTLAGSVVAALDRDRRDFVAEEGATNIVVSGGIRITVTGLLLLFLPVSLLRALSVVDVGGGRGLIVVTDVDTLFQGAVIVAVFILLFRHRAAVKVNLPFVAFTGLLAAALAVPMAYVVANYGTLFRLRMIAILPLWLLALAASETPAAAPRRAAGSK